MQPEANAGAAGREVHHNTCYKRAAGKRLCSLPMRRDHVSFTGWLHSFHYRKEKSLPEGIAKEFEVIVSQACLDIPKKNSYCFDKFSLIRRARED